MRCYDSVNASYRTVGMVAFSVNCPKYNRACNTKSKAYVAAITVCAQRLW